MKIEQSVFAGTLALTLVIANPGFSASLPGAPDGSTELVITALPIARASQPSSLQAIDLQASDVKVLQGKTPVPVVRLQRLAGDLADMQLVVLLDDSTRSSSLGTHLSELKTFLQSLPSTTLVAVGYMRNGTFASTQAFTADHQEAVRALRLPESVPGENGSPYFALSDLVKHWPSKQPTDRRAVLMLTDGVDRYFGSATIDDPYVDTAIRDSLKEGVLVYSSFLRGAGLYDRGDLVTNFGQSRLMEVSQDTGGHAYFQNFSDPVSITPFLGDFQDRLDHQYRVTIQALNEKGVQHVKLRTELPNVKIEGPTQIYVQ
jgi:hypothetical protein